MQPLDNTHLHTLDNGLKIIHVQNQSLVAWCGLAVNAGSRDDPDGRFGLAHFVEHTIFKGTTHRKAWHILNRMENVGGELNAYTTKENTMLYSVFPHGHEQRALELIADLVNWSVFPKAELDKEREVVIEEVMSYRDTPAEAIFDDFEDMVFAGSQLGHNILGVEKDLDNITSQECSAYLKTLYVPGNMVLFSVGPEKPERIFRLAEKHFAAMNHPLSATAKRTAPPIMQPAHNATHFDLHQSHTIVGARLPSMFSEERFTFSLLNNIVGGPGMNSLLNLYLRERKGLVYTVESSLAQYSDCGLMQIYFGCDHHHTGKVMNIVANTLNQLAEHPLSDRKLHDFKRQYCGQLLVAADSAEFIAMNAGKNLLYWGKAPHIARTVERIMDITAEELRTAAQHIAFDRCSSLTFT